ncbi:MAG: C25 family cysteine peptidase [Pseudomonadota bacterium]
MRSGRVVAMLLALVFAGAGFGQTPAVIVDTAILPATPTGFLAPFQTITFPQPFAAGVTPVVVVMPTDENCTPGPSRPPPPVADCEPANVRIRNVSNTGFEAVQIEPPDGSGGCAGYGGCDNAHLSMTLHYIAAAPGAYPLPDGTQIEVGTVSTTTSQDNIPGGGPPNGWVNVPFTAALGGAPVLLTMVQTVNNEFVPLGYLTTSEPYIGTAVQGINAGGFQTAVELFEVSFIDLPPVGLNSPETIGWIAFPNSVRSTLDDGNGNMIGWGTLSTPRNIKGFEADVGAIPGQCYNNSVNGVPGTVSSPIAVVSKDTRQGNNGGWFRRCNLATAPGAGSTTNITVGVFTDEDQDRDIERQHQGTEDASIVVFGGPLVTTPVSLATFESRRDGEDIHLGWVVAGEVANAGFRVLGRRGDGPWLPLHSDLVPSQAIDQREPEAYAITVNAPGITEVVLEDLDTNGRKSRRGPFRVGERHGAMPRDVAIDWRPARAAKAAARPKTMQTDARLFVDTTGIQRVTHAELLAAGVDLTGERVRQIAVVDEGIGVRRFVAGEKFWDASSFVEFVGTARDALYGDENAHVLTVDRSLAVVAQEREGAFDLGADAVPEAVTIAAADNNRYGFTSPLADPWFDVELSTIRSRSATRVFDAADAAAPEAVLEADIWGVTNFPDVAQDHHVQLSFDGEIVATRRFDTGAVTLSAPVVLGPGPQEATIEVLDDSGAPYSLVNLERVALTFERPPVASDGRWVRSTGAGSKDDPADDAAAEKATNVLVSGFATPSVIAWTRDGKRRVVPEAAATGSGDFAITLSLKRRDAAFAADEAALLRPRIEAGLRRPATPVAVDYLIIAAAPFAAAAEAIVPLQEVRGLRAEVVDLDGIFAAYSDHVPDADAIRRYIAESFGDRFGYVLLVGDDSHDYHDYLGSGSVSFLPTSYSAVSELIRFAPTDALLGDVDGDQVPDLAVGRLPVRTVAELEGWIAKRAAVESHVGAALFTADRKVSVIERDDEFTIQSQILEQSLGALTDVAYHTELGAAGLRAAIGDAFAGRYPLVNFVGHSSFGLLSFDRVLDVPAVNALAPGDLVGTLAAWGCWNAYFVSPTIEDLGSALVRRPDAGAATFVGSSTLVDGDASLLLAAYFFERARDPARTVGQALIEAKQRLDRTRPGSTDAILGITILGDPADELRVEPATP